MKVARTAAVPNAASAWRFDTATTRAPTASASPFTQASPTRTPVNDPGPDAAAKHSMAVNLLCSGRLEQAGQLAARNPDTRLVVDHLGLPQPLEPPPPAQPWAELPKVPALAAYPNVAIKITGACTLAHKPFPYRDIWDPLGRIFDKGITIKQGQAPVTNYIDHLIELVKSEKVVLNDIISHRLPLSRVSYAYDIFKNKEEDCVKSCTKPMGMNQ